jgi:glycine oxidase
VEHAGFDERATAGGVQSLLNAAAAVLSGISDATFIEARVGLRPATPTGLPVIRRSTTHPSIVYATGHFRNGILLAPLTGRLVADLVC